MSRIKFAEQHYEAAAKMLREMADILEQRPDDVVAINHTITTDNIALVGGPSDYTFTVSIETRNMRRK